MGRVKTPDGKRIPLALKVSEGKAAAVRAAAGGKPVALWLEALIDAALAAEGISTAPPDSVAPVIPVRRPVVRRGRAKSRTVKVPEAAPVSRPAGAGVFQEPGGEPVVTAMPPVPAVQRRRCTHPGVRMIGGYCPTCEHVIEPGGYWRE